VIKNGRFFKKEIHETGLRILWESQKLSENNNSKSLKEFSKGLHWEKVKKENGASIMDRDNKLCDTRFGHEVLSLYLRTDQIEH
jgi:hypothetical protein